MSRDSHVSQFLASSSYRPRSGFSSSSMDSQVNYDSMPALEDPNSPSYVCVNCNPDLLCQECQEMKMANGPKIIEATPPCLPEACDKKGSMFAEGGSTSMTTFGAVKKAAVKKAKVDIELEDLESVVAVPATCAATLAEARYRATEPSAPTTTRTTSNSSTTSSSSNDEYTYEFQFMKQFMKHSNPF